ncbi:MAG: carboxypeptidase regulatory-like domain-containing protein [Planctomycetes bacterium]|nr:carboxypeptidase regulatory-like domain-containing protein [Planctomycetota bacterium]
MPRSKIFIAAGFLLGIFAIFAIWQPQDSTPIESSDAGSIINSPVADPVNHADLEDGPEEASRSKDLGALQPIEATANATKLPIQPRYEGENGVLISGEDLRSGQTVPNADVFVMNSATFFRYRNNAPPDTDERHVLFILRKHGKRFQADADGYARIPPITEKSFVSVEKGDLIGAGSGLKMSMDEFSVTVRPRKPLVAKVVDLNGNPVEGVPVSIRSTYYSNIITSSTRRTDASGIARFFSISMLTQKAGGSPTFYARLEVPKSPLLDVDPLGVELTEEILETGEISLTLSEVGGVRVQVVNQQGEPFLAAGHVSLCLKDWVWGTPSSHYVTEPVENGVANFPYVGVGATFKATFQPMGGRNEDEIAFKGPQQVGEWAEVSISATDWPFVSGILLDPNGEIIADKAVFMESKIVVKERSPSGGHAEVLTGPDGRFEYELYRLTDGRVVLSRSGSWTADLPEFGICRATLDFPHPLQPGENDLGEITLAVAQAILSGRILDGSEQPIAGATIELKAIQKSNQNGRTSRRSRETSVSGESDRQGEFKILDELPDAPEYKVTITAPGYDSLTQEISPGTQGVDFVLGQSGSLAGTVLLDEGVEYHSLFMTLNCPGVKYVSIRLEPTMDPTKFLLHANAEIGRIYRLEMRTWLHEELLTLENLSFLPGEELRPAELQPLDLRGKLKGIRITLQDTEGKRLEGSYSITRENGYTGSDVSANGTLLTTIQDEFEEIEVSAKGYRPKTLLNVRSDQLVTLEKAMSCVIQIPNEFVRYRGTEASYSLKPEGSDVRLPGEVFHPSGRSTIYLPGPGKFDLTLHFVVTDNFLHYQRAAETIPLSLEYEGQVIEVSVNQTALDSKIDEIEKEGD